MTLHERLTELLTEAELPDETAQLAWAAFDSEGSLQRVLAGDPFDQADSIQGSRDHKPVWLNSIRVQGFRGIGPSTELLLNPGPGLTLVVGRNGSGKSSFAEGLEALLTGNNQRWRDRPAPWRDGWLNLHAQDDPGVSAEFQREGEDEITEVSRSFAESFEDSTAVVHVNGATQPYESLGWDDPLETYKPFLSYNELGTMLEQKPAAIYDSIAGVLGLDQLTEAMARLKKARLEAEKPGKELKRRTPELKDTLDGIEDPRAAEALEELGSRSPDLDGLQALTASDAFARPELKVLADLTAPDPNRCEEAAAALEAALAAHSTQSGSEADRAARVADLLLAALDHHRHAGDAPCPVCGAGVLDSGWSIRAQAEAEELRSEAAGIKAALDHITSCRQDGLVCLTKPPTRLSTQPKNSNGAALNAAWQAWASTPSGGFSEVGLIARLREAPELSNQVANVKAAAAAELDELDEDWRPVAAQLAIWVEEARTAQAATALAKRLKKAEEFLRTAEAQVREERFAPIAAQSAELWDGLRQQSNVSLESVALAGKNTQRRVDLDVTVDGTETSALGVMSQGELHALALALFLPRVTANASPFRFVMIDDPVQAMDAARVDGLARVLHHVARTRQVVVFTHDDRLPAACRRLRLDAEVIQVDRRPGSKVSTRWVDSPAKSALEDAFALAKTESLPPPLKQRIVPMHCRRAVEAATRDEVWRRMLQEGRGHEDVERALADVRKTTDLLALLFFGQPASTPEVYDELGRIERSLKDRLSLLNKATHDTVPGLDPERLVKDSRKLVRAVEEYLG